MLFRSVGRVEEVGELGAELVARTTDEVLLEVVARERVGNAKLLLVEGEEVGSGDGGRGRDPQRPRQQCDRVPCCLRSHPEVEFGGRTLRSSRRDSILSSRRRA